MEDFINYANNGRNKATKNSGQTDNKVNKNLFDLVNSLGKKFDGKNQSELVKAIYEEARRGKMNGTLTDRDIDNFVRTLSPFLDDKKRKILYKITDQLKKI